MTVHWRVLHSRRSRAPGAPAGTRRHTYKCTNIQICIHTSRMGADNTERQHHSGIGAELEAAAAAATSSRQTVGEHNRRLQLQPCPLARTCCPTRAHDHTPVMPARQICVAAPSSHSWTTESVRAVHVPHRSTNRSAQTLPHRNVSAPCVQQIHVGWNIPLQHGCYLRGRKLHGLGI